MTIISDGKRALITGVALDSLAALVVFAANPGGFETQGAWAIVLLPATLPVLLVADWVYKYAPYAEPFVFWTLVIGLNFLWYWFLSYVVLKIYRALSGT